MKRTYSLEELLLLHLSETATLVRDPEGDGRVVAIDGVLDIAVLTAFVLELAATHVESNMFIDVGGRLVPQTPLEIARGMRLLARATLG